MIIKSRRKSREARAGYLFILPAVILFLCFVAFPLIVSFGLMFCDYNLIQAPEIVGMTNLLKFFNDREVGSIFLNSLKLLAVLVPTHVVLGLALAYLVNETGKKLSGVYRVIIYLPTIMTTVSVATAWSYLYDTDFGVINYYLGKIGIGKIPWLASSKWALAAIILFSIWKFVGTPFLYYYIGLQGIPASLYEAAEIDGANRREKFRYVTLPMLTSTIFMVIVLSFISYLQCFDEPYVLTKGGPGISTTTVSLYIYRNFQAQNISYASILSVVLFIIIMIITALQFKASNKWVNYDSE
ncbi:sugar ABC transporter permease [Lachnospiraceae bacterium ASD3451]|uniref:carbohydrate ABC transporter permease n=1 Tax=Diplocloster agilis TaxID=2850323 RepID=UPI001DC040BE|nr:sugar ABC transporter permease [Diplocloster agilis]MBU9746662.1 sugar ABC transporter permease [Diplocloster agilis]